MKVLIAMDIEGVAGVCRPEQTRAGHADYEHARRWMCGEANAAIRGAFAAGASEVLVNDSHGNFCNLLAHDLDPRAWLIQGKPRQLSMMAGVDQGVDAVCLVGWHSMAKTPGVLAHTSNGFAFARVSIDGREVGELGLYARLAASHGVPVLMGSGDDCFGAEFEALLPQAEFAVVKKAQGANVGQSLHPSAACERIEAAVTRALSRRSQVPLLQPERDFRLGLQCQTPALAELFALLPQVERVSADLLQLQAPDIAYALRMLNAMSAMSFALR